MRTPEIITSRRHALVEELRSIRDDRDSRWMFLEGPRLARDILGGSSPIEILVWTPSAREGVLKDVHRKANREYEVSDSVFEALSDVETPQGIVAIARRPEWGWNDVMGQTPAPVVVLDGIQDPGNVATLLRTADAAGAGGIVTTEGTAHLFSPKALRGAMGSTLRLPCLEHRPIPEILSHIRAATYGLAAATMRSHEKASISYNELDWKKPWAILLGQEGKGLSTAWDADAPQFVHIPMRPPVESLNVAAAGAVLLYESNRQRS